MKEKRYTKEDFLADKNFVEWVKQPTKEHDFYWMKWLENHPEDKETLLNARRTITNIKFREINHSEERFNRVFDKILRDERSARYPEKNYHSKDDRVFWFSIAATISFIAIFSFLLLKDQQDSGVIAENSKETFVKFSNPKGKKSKFRLPDSTYVVLNAASSLTIQSDFLESRKVELIGEAYFEVEKRYGSFFTVAAGDLNTIVLGTKFNIQSYPEDSLTTISLVEGRVKVENNNLSSTDKFSLEPNQELKYQTNSGEFWKGEFKVGEELAWKDGVIAFNHSGLQEVITKIERWYGVNVYIEGKPVDNWQLTGYFQNQNIKGLAESITFAKGIKYRVEGQNLILDFN